jgi:hypothetical protein
VDDELSISLQSNHLSTLNMEDGLRCALYSTQLSIKTLSETIEILISSGTSVLLHFYSLCPSKATCKIFKNVTFAFYLTTVWKHSFENCHCVCMGSWSEKVSNTVLNKRSISSKSDISQLFGSYATPLRVCIHEVHIYIYIYIHTKRQPLDNTFLQSRTD